MKTLCKTLRGTVALLALLASGFSIANTPQIAIIIDDLGYKRTLGEQAIELPYPLTYAVIPFAPNSKELAEKAFFSDKEVILHMPMESINGKDMGDYGIRSEHSKKEVQERLRNALNELPFVVGFNNHMGSGVTTNLRIMSWLMEEAAGTPLYFVDSRTHADSKAYDAAVQYNIPALRRDVFLDADNDIGAINKQFKRLIAIAKKQGYAVGIGHPYTETLALLKAKLPKLSALGVKLVPVSQLLPYQGTATRVDTTKKLALLPIDKERLKKHGTQTKKVTLEQLFLRVESMPLPTPSKGRF